MSLSILLPGGGSSRKSKQKSSQIIVIDLMKLDTLYGPDETASTQAISTTSEEESSEIIDPDLIRLDSPSEPDESATSEEESIPFIDVDLLSLAFPSEPVETVSTQPISATSEEESSEIINPDLIKLDSPFEPDESATSEEESIPFIDVDLLSLVFRSEPIETVSTQAISATSEEESSEIINPDLIKLDSPFEPDETATPEESIPFIDVDLLSLVFRSEPVETASSQTISSIPQPIDHKKKGKRKLGAGEDNDGGGEVDEPHRKKKKKVRFTDDVPFASTTKSEKHSKGKKEKEDRRSKKKLKKRLQERVDEPAASDAACHDPPKHNRPAGNNSDGDNEPSHLVHESIPKTPRKIKAVSKFVPPDETAEQRDARTIFVGNLPIEVAQKQPLLKQLQRHILYHVPNAKIESTRFRSITVQTPTSQLPNSDDEDGSTKAKKTTSKPYTFLSRMQTHQHFMTNWIAGPQTTEIKGDDKKFLNPNQKKIAFINQDFHSGSDTVNAYIMFSYPPLIVARPANLPPRPDTLDPHEAARRAVTRCNGTIFMERMIHVDLAKPSEEEDLRVLFEAFPGVERALPGAHGNDELRLQQCKTLPVGSSIEHSVVPEDSTSHPTPRTMGPPVSVSKLAVKDHPFYGRKPAHLSKGKHKEVKSADADRVAKRLANKKARNALEAPSKESERVEELTACVDREDSGCTFH